MYCRIDYLILPNNCDQYVKCHCCNVAISSYQGRCLAEFLGLIRIAWPHLCMFSFEYCDARVECAPSLNVASQLGNTVESKNCTI